ncbi:unnamed protein product [Rhizophagus irregularis]|nr:unnamed protein product [Rhizophagus irregularis]
MASNKILNDDIQSPRIKFQHFIIFSSWIEKKNDSHYRYHSLKDIPYHFNLIYRASRDDRRDTKTAKVGYSNGIYSIGCYPSYGPIFGGDFSCRDDGTAWKFNNIFCSYPNIGIPIGSIDVDDYEVFQVIKKTNPE